MSEITLQEYQSRLEELLQRQKNDEVVQHCRHILQYFPKNAATYRLMGRALIGSGRYPEANEVFRRVLSVDPADFQAHLGLSRVAQNQKNGDLAIWHLERAFEQDPNDKELLDQLQDLYRQYRGVEQTRFQLTARAVAIQQLHNGLYAQAIDTLKKALTQAPNRIDLKLLMATVLWEIGYGIEAAEAALDILKSQPDCLEANRILTKLWLSEQRPSDAQRYLSRIEAVDPYYAFEVAQGAPPPENAFRIAELDYQLEASRQIATSSPDWLQSFDQLPAEDETGLAADLALDEVGEDEDGDWLGQILDEPGDASDELEPIGNDDWLQEVENVQASASEKTRSVSTEHIQMTEENLADLFGDDDWMTADEPADEFDDEPTPTTPAATSSGQNTGLTGLLASLDDRRGGSGLTGLLNVLEGGTADDELTAADEEEDWVRAVNKPTAPLRDPFKKQTTSDLDPKIEADDPLAWLTQTDDTEDELQTIDTGDLLSNDEADPLAWMKQDGIEYVEDAPASLYNPTLDTLDDARPISDPNENRPMAWLEGSGIEILDDADDDDDPLAWMRQDDVPVKTDDLPTNDADPLAWMRGSGIELNETAEIARRPSAPLEPEPEEEVTNKLDWLAVGDDQLDELFDLETMVEQGTGILSAAEQDRQETMTDDNDNLIPDWLSSGDDEEPADDDRLEWLSGDVDKANEAEPATPDWLRQPQASTPAANAADLFGDLDDETSDDDEEMPDWISAMAASRNNPADAVSSGDDEDNAADLDWQIMDEDDLQDDDAAVPDWLGTVGGASAADPVSAADENDVPDWLAGVGSGVSTVPAGAPLFGNDDAENDFDFTLDDEDDEEAVADVPDWLSGVGGVDNIPAPSFAAGMFGTDDDDEDADALGDFDFTLDDEDEAVAADVPDWLSGVGGADDEETEATPAPSFTAGMFGTDDDDEDAAALGNFDFTLDDEDEAVAADVPDWLSGVGVGTTDDEETETASAPSFAAGMFGTDDDDDADALGDFDFTLDDEEAVAADVPDWLSGVGVGTTDDEETETASAPSFAAGMFGTDDDDEDADALGDFDFTLDDEDEEAVAADVPDWLSGVGVGTTDDEETETASAPSFTAGMFGTDDDDEDEAVAADVPDWLSGVGAVDDEEEAASAPSFAAGMFGTDEDDDDADALGDFDFTLDDEDEDEAVAAEVPDWLSSVGSVEDKTEVEPVSNFAAGMFGSDDNDDADADALGDFDFDLDEEDEIEAETAPDWLAAVAPTDTTSTDRLQEREMATSAASLFDDEDEDALDFSWETDDEAETTPDWLAGVGTTSAADDELEPDTEAVPDWLNSLDENDAEDKIAAATAYDPVLEADFVDDEPVGTLAEELAPTPASNAPDWLNAMVPGLDVDYVGDNDSEPDAKPAAPAARQGSDFTWLTTIVNEELAPPVSMPEKLGQSPIRQAASRAMKYAFSRPPSWLRRLRGETEAAPVLTGESLDEDDDLPPWLQFDGDDSQ